MVPDPRAPLGARTLRSLSGGSNARANPDDPTRARTSPEEPIPVRVEIDPDGCPTTVQRRGWSQPRPVARVQDQWRIDDEWWRERPIARVYHALLLDDGTFLVLYHDEVADAWFEAESRLRRLEPLDLTQP